MRPHTEYKTPLLLRGIRLALSLNGRARRALRFEQFLEVREIFFVRAMPVCSITRPSPFIAIRSAPPTRRSTSASTLAIGVIHSRRRAGSSTSTTSHSSRRHLSLRPLGSTRSPHEARVFEDTNVLGHSGQGHPVGRGELGYPRAARSQLIQHTAADRMGDRSI